MPYVACNNCVRMFYVKPNRLAKGWGKFCSNQCQNDSQKTGERIPCHRCKKMLYRNVAAINSSISKKFFCGRSCQTKWRNSEVYIGSQHGNWVSGESSYRSALKRSGAEMVCAKCLTRDSRVLAVHHKDKNRQNNKLTNLIWLCHNCHFLVHHHPAEAVGFLVGG